MHPPHASPAAIATLLLTLLTWSATPLFITAFARDIDPWTSNGWRYVFSALLFAPILLRWAPRGRSAGTGLWTAARLPALLNALAQTAFTLSFYLTDPTSATFGLRAQIVFVALGAYLLFPAERALLRDRRSWLAIALVLSGVAGTILLAPGATSADQRDTHMLGVAVAVVSGLLFAAYGLAVRKRLHGFHPVPAFGVISQYTALILVGFMLLLARNKATGVWDGGLSVWSLTPPRFALLVLSSVVGIALGHVFYYTALSRVGVAVTSGVIQLQPFVVALGSYALLGQPVTRGQVGSGLVALCGATLLLSVQWMLSRRLRRDAAEPGRFPIDAGEAACARCGYELEEGSASGDCPRCGPAR